MNQQPTTPRDHDVEGHLAKVKLVDYEADDVEGHGACSGGVQADGRGRPGSRFKRVSSTRRPRSAALLTLLAIAAVIFAVFAPPAGATVAQGTGIEHCYPSQFGRGCTVSVGDERSPYFYAIGEIDTWCPAGTYVHLHEMVYLYRNGVLQSSGWSDTWGSSIQAVTTPPLCGGGSASWQTVGYVWVNGAKFGPYVSYTGAFSPGHC